MTLRIISGGGVFMKPNTQSYDKASCTEPMKAAKSKRTKFIIAGIIILIAGVLFYTVYKTVVPVEYRIFTEERVGALEREYNMKLSDAELKRYWTPAFAQDIYDHFQFSVKDYSNFMENNYFGEIVFYDKSSDNSYAEYKCKPYPNGEYHGFTFVIRFQKNRDKYLVDLVSYHE